MKRYVQQSLHLLLLTVLLIVVLELNTVVYSGCSWKYLPKCKTPRKHYKPKTNGCGPQNQLLSGLVNVISSSTSREFIECCNQHDSCYGQCGMTKHDCDEQFRKCMINKCYMDIACRVKAFSLFNVVSKETPWSCRAFIVGQVESCDCSSSTAVAGPGQQQPAPLPSSVVGVEEIISLPEPSIKLYKLKLN